MKPRLIPAQDVLISEKAFYAETEAPWLLVDCDAQRLAGRWIELAYVAGLLEPLTRPILRCVVAGERTDQFLPGALFGRASWIGVIPENTTEIYLSPTNRSGRFDFELVDL